MGQPKVSFVIPVYNAEKYLRQCLNSILVQTSEEIEVICIDDASTDGSVDILTEYVEKDPRVKIYIHTENKTASLSRKEGVNYATGKYIWFVDADDMIFPDACEKLVALAEKKNVDILQFNTEVVNEGNLPASRVDGYKKFLTPYPGELRGENVFKGCFEKEIYQFTIWNKLFSSQLCKKAFQYVEDIPLPIAQDKYAFFVLAYFAKSYFGTSELCLYRYRLGAGGTAKNLVTREQHSRHCKMAWVADAMERFLEQQGTAKKYQEIIDKSRRQLMRSCVGEWNNRCLREDKAWGYDEMLRSWRPAEVVAEIARLNWINKHDVATTLKTSEFLQKRPRRVKKLGVYYHHLSIGGAQKVVADLIWIWKSMGYECVLITDTEPGKYDYEIPSDVPRVTIPSYFNLTQENYSDRAETWASIIEEYQLDVVVYHAWMANCILWDIMMIKALKTDVLVHCHGVFSMLLQSMPIYWGEMPAIFHLADSIVTLGKADCFFWKQFNPRTHMVINPIPIKITASENASLENKNVVWVGRVSDEKRPFDCIEIAAKVVREVPNVKFFLVGDSENRGNYLADLKRRAKQLGIEDAIIFTGFQKDVRPYYLNASAFLMTSNYEGFSLTLLEAKAFGVPCVMYELPYLLLTEGERGILPVKMGDVNAAASALVKVLTEEDERIRLGVEGKEHALEISEFDYVEVWTNIFGEFEKELNDAGCFEAEIMWHALLEHYRIGATKRGREVFMLNKQVDELKRGKTVVQTVAVSSSMATDEELLVLKSEIAAIQESWTYRIGSFVTFLPRALRRVKACYKEHGWGYTISKIKQRMPDLSKGWRP